MTYGGAVEWWTLSSDEVAALTELGRKSSATLYMVLLAAMDVLLHRHTGQDDIRIGTPRARTSFLFTRVGLSGADMGACAILPRIIGQGRASELLFTGRTMPADEAERWGFFNRLCAPDALLHEAHSLAASLANGPVFANATTKRQLHQEWSMSVDEAIDAEAQAQAICMQTADFAGAYRDFRNKKSEIRQCDC